MVVLVSARNNNKRGTIWLVPGISATFIGTVVGAGFASGQEIYQFFSKNGVLGFWGILLSVVLMGIAGIKVFQIGYQLKPRSYQEFLVFLFGRHFATIIDFVIFSFLVILIGVMFAGSGAIFESLKLNYWVGIFLTAFLLIMILLKGLPGLIAANLVVIPLMFAGSIGIALYSIHTQCTFIDSNFSYLDWILPAIQFSSYNLVLAIPVLLSLAKEFPFIPCLKCGSWLGSIGLGIMAGFIHWALLCHITSIQNSALPVIELAKLLGKWPYQFYAMILWGEMFTTLLANTYGVVQRLVAFTKWTFQCWLIVITLLGIAIAQFGFINLIANLYPFYGYLCLVIVGFLFVNVKNCKY